MRGMGGASHLASKRATFCPITTKKNDYLTSISIKGKEHKKKPSVHPQRALPCVSTCCAAFNNNPAYVQHTAVGNLSASSLRGNYIISVKPLEALSHTAHTGASSAARSNLARVCVRALSLCVCVCAC